MTLRGKSHETVPTVNTRDNKKPLFVLLVEDDKGDAFLARRTVYGITEKNSKHDYYLDHVVSLKEAIRALGTGKYSTVLLDLSLVDAGGLEAVEAIKRKFPNQPLVILTNNDDERLKLDAKSKGISAYLHKRDLEKNPRQVAEALDAVN